MFKSIKKSAQKTFNQFTWTVYRKFPMYYQPKRIKRRLESRKEDQEKNDALKLEDDDLALVQSLFAVEVFTPSQSDLLFSKLHKLSASRREGSSDVLDFIEKLRSSFFGGGSANLGVFAREEAHQRSWTGNATSSDIPEFADVALDRVVQISPSITAIIIEFKLRNSEKSRLYDTYNKDYETKIIPFKKNMHYSTSGPSFRKRDEVYKIRNGWRIQIERWFKDEFAGAFCSSEGLASIPITEVIELSKSRPFTREGSNPVASALGIDSSFSVWSLDGLEDLKFSSTNNFSMHDRKPWTTIAYRLPELEDIDNSDSEFSSYHLSERYRSVIIALGVQNLLEMYGKVLSKERDHLNLGWKKIAPYSRLKRLEKLDLKRADISLTLSDVLEFEEQRAFSDIP